MLYCMEHALNFSFITKKHVKTIKFMKKLTVLSFFKLKSCFIAWIAH